MNIFETIASKIRAFTLFDLCRANSLIFELFFNNYEVVRSR